MTTVVPVARRMSPPRHELDSLRTPLGDGERQLLEILDTKLPASWDIYVQPHLNGCRPDLVVLDRRHGVALLEVKEWKSVDAVAVATALGRLRLYEQEIQELYCPALGIHAGAIAHVSARLVLMNISRDRLRRMAPELCSEAIVCGDELVLKRLVPVAFRTRCDLSDDALADLRSWLDEPRCAREQRYPLFRELSAKQRAIIGEGAGSSGQRRIRGSAGAGKSLVLAARAAHLAKFEARRGLVTSYNLTLLHYLRDLAVRYPIPERNSLVNEFVTWMHFHGWCKRICIQAGLGAEYAALWNRPDREQTLAEAVPALTRRALEINNPRYDFILVDEGQDWQLEWWKTLQAALRPGGEMMLVADRTQDIYGTGKKWTDDAMTGAGFRGAWTSLDQSYRLPPSLVPTIREFASEYIRDDIHLPEPAAQAALMECERRWHDVERGREAASCADAVAALHRGDFLRARTSPPDIVLLVQSGKVGEECVSALHARGYKVCHTFGPDSRSNKRLKHAFFRGDARLKATTVQSFKGFENPVVVVVITRAASEHDFRGIYAALTRVKHDPAGSALVVINSAPALREFGARFRPTDDRGVPPLPEGP